MGQSTYTCNRIRTVWSPTWSVMMQLFNKIGSDDCDVRARLVIFKYDY